MVDKRFVQAGDMLADLEAKPNLMDLNPFEFENLVTNLFQKMGLETKLIRSSCDGGVTILLTLSFQSTYHFGHLSVISLMNLLSFLIFRSRLELVHS